MQAKSSASVDELVQYLSQLDDTKKRAMRRLINTNTEATLVAAVTMRRLTSALKMRT